MSSRSLVLPRPAPPRGRTAWHASARAGLVAGLVAALAVAAGCRSAGGTEAPDSSASMGYGGSLDMATGYESELASRPAPTPWETPAQDEDEAYLDVVAPQAIGELVDLCLAVAKLADAEPERSCPAHMDTARAFRTPEGWAELSACIYAARSPEAALACETQHPAGVRAVAAAPRESAACMRILAVSSMEPFAEVPGLSAEALADFQPLLEGCVDTLLAEAETRSAATHEAVLGCIEVAYDSADLSACEGEG
ncbi:hypothetical protein G6O69_18155 [Pseudenhygromyxa sp. WMMC2535]|uniref:hypothetical protein n=1 Tax=Pseudenhygromyxa sp. WMMC2535 TaxID=2712867 RepID=UPI001553FD22|nr:hypothetical protein [Pseudenhygromyxa sp. WMMC2535]NVB39773.1 hypothetical protein [Pseudenhygromyxa sp. WMMC2535]